jgi:protein-disulfide isomerase
LAGLTLGIVAGVIIVGVLARGGGGTGAPDTIVVPAARPAAIAQSGHTYGDPNAPVTIDEYIDFQCPFCKIDVTSVMPTIEQQFVATGVAKVVAHPIAILGDESVQAAAAAEAANQQGKFWTYFDALYANQGNENSGAFSNDRLKAIAEAVGIDLTAFDTSFNSGANQTQVTQDTQAARAAGVSGTPTVLVNGSRVEATVAAISAAIQAVSGS